MPAVSSPLSTWILVLPPTLCLLFAASCGYANPADLRLIAQTGDTTGGARLTTLRPGVSIKNRSTSAVAAPCPTASPAVLNKHP
jgi:hypothetical protein